MKVISERAKAARLTVVFTEGGSHTKVVVGSGRQSVIPRHRDINERTASAILRQLFPEG